MKKLIDAGADVDAARERPDPGLGGSVVGPGGPTPLQAARAMGHGECVAVLLEHGAAEAAWVVGLFLDDDVISAQQVWAPDGAHGARRVDLSLRLSVTSSRDASSSSAEICCAVPYPVLPLGLERAPQPRARSPGRVPA